MSVFTAIAFATFFLENDYFVTFYEGNEHLAIYFCAFNGRHSDFYIAVGIYEKHFVESNCVALFYFVAEMVDIKEFTFFSLKLLSFDFYDSVHLLFLIESQLDPLGVRIHPHLFRALAEFATAKLQFFFLSANFFTLFLPRYSAAGMSSGVILSSTSFFLCLKGSV